MKRFLTYIFLTLAIIACTKEENVPEASFQPTLHYSVSVSSAETKASLNSDNQYCFQVGDRLYIRSDNNIWGYLHLVSGAGGTNAVFEGDLAAANDFTPSSDTPVTVTLVSSSDRIHEVSGGKIISTSYPTDEFASSFAEAVEKFSNFTATGEFGDNAFTLAQQSAFVQLEITVKKDVFPGAITVELIKGVTSVKELEITSPTQNDVASRASLFIAFPGGEVFDEGIQIKVSDSDSETSLSPVPAVALQANTHYTLRRTDFSWNGFAIKASTNGTVVRFVYGTDSDGTVQYSLDQGGFWYNYTANTPINLNANDKLCIRSNRQTYNRWDQNNAIFSSNQLCYISGNIMSLICLDGFEDLNEVGSDVFNCAFSKSNKNGTYSAINYIDIEKDNQGRPMLLLPAEKLGAKCYKGMFKGNTGLTIAPDLPAPNPFTSNQCYANMFTGCTNLIYIKCMAEIQSNSTTNECFKDWLKDSNANTREGTFVKKQGTVWPEGIIPTNWVVEESTN